MNIPVSEIRQSSAEHRIRLEILNSALHQLNSNLIIVNHQKPHQRLSEEIDQIPEEYYHGNKTAEDYQDIIKPVTLVKAKKRYHTHGNLCHSDYCSAS